MIVQNLDNFSSQSSEWLDTACFVEGMEEVVSSIGSKKPKRYGCQVEVLSILDVICGRDKQASLHEGNKHYRHLILSHYERYQKSTQRDQKTNITSHIIELVHKSGGRFVVFDDKLKSWYELSREHVHDKVSHALRTTKNPSCRKPRKVRKKQVVIAPTDMEIEFFRVLVADQEKIFEEFMEGRED